MRRPRGQRAPSLWRQFTRPTPIRPKAVIYRAADPRPIHLSLNRYFAGEPDSQVTGVVVQVGRQVLSIRWAWAKVVTPTEHARRTVDDACRDVTP